MHVAPIKYTLIEQPRVYFNKTIIMQSSKKVHTSVHLNSEAIIIFHTGIPNIVSIQLHYTVHV